ncbi:MAG: PqqD family protein [Acidobacteria bacterium]|nr:PqqD family protein [Acidobacteriota bacterium]
MTEFAGRNLNGFLPESRVEKIVVKNIGDEILVYDLKSNRAHGLNRSISEVWRNCDGKTSIEEIAFRLSQRFDAEIGVDFVELALAELSNANLLIATDDTLRSQKVSRRKVLLKYALPAVALPVIISIAAPQAAAAQSTACMLRCVPIGTDACAGCIGNTIDVTLYNGGAPGTCSGAVLGTTSIMCTGTNNVGGDVSIDSFV